MSLPLLSACQSLQDPQAARNTQAELEKMQQATPVQQPLQVPAAVHDDLLSPLPPQRTDLLLPRFNVSALNVELSEFFASLVLDSDYSVMVHPSVQGQISLQLKQVTLPEVLQVIQQMYGFDVRLTGNAATLWRWTMFRWMWG